MRVWKHVQDHIMFQILQKTSSIHKCRKNSTVTTFLAFGSSYKLQIWQPLIRYFIAFFLSLSTFWILHGLGLLSSSPHACLGLPRLLLDPSRDPRAWEQNSHVTAVYMDPGKHCWIGKQGLLGFLFTRVSGVWLLWLLRGYCSSKTSNIQLDDLFLALAPLREKYSQSYLNCFWHLLWLLFWITIHNTPACDNIICIYIFKP